MNAEGGFPGSHTTGTTVRSTTSVNPMLRFDPTYVRTLPGILKGAQMVSNLLGFICVSVSDKSNAHNANWTALVTMGGVFITFALLMLFLFHVIEKLYFVPWLLVEAVYGGIWAFFFFTAGTAMSSMGHMEDAFAAAAFFCYLSMLLYGVDCYLKYTGWKAGDIAQGERVIKSSTTNVQSA